MSINWAIGWGLSKSQWQPGEFFIFTPATKHLPHPNDLLHVFWKRGNLFPFVPEALVSYEESWWVEFFWGGRGIFVHQVSDELHTKVIFTFEAVEWVSDRQSVSIGIGNDVVDQWLMINVYHENSMNDKRYT